MNSEQLKLDIDRLYDAVSIGFDVEINKLKTPYKKYKYHMAAATFCALLMDKYPKMAKSQLLTYVYYPNEAYIDNAIVWLNDDIEISKPLNKRYSIARELFNASKP